MLGLKLGLGVSGRAGGGVPENNNPLRSGSVLNRTSTFFLTSGGFTRFIFEYPHVLGQDADKLVLEVHNHYINEYGAFGPGNGLKLFEAYARSADNVVKQFKWAGSTFVDMVDGAMGDESDGLFPSDFGANKFSQDEEYTIRVEYELPTGTSNIPLDGQTSLAYGGATGWAYTPGPGVTVSDPSQPLNVSGGNAFALNTGHRPYLLARPIVDGFSAVGVTDSIGVGAGDNEASQGKWGHGILQRAMHDDNFQNCRGFIHLGKAGSNCDSYTTNGMNIIRHYYKYGKCGIVGLLTNDANPQYQLSAPDYLQPRLSGVIQDMREEGCEKIIVLSPICRTYDASGQYSTKAGQVPQQNWEAGGSIDAVRAWLAAGAGGMVDYVITMDAARDPTDPHYFLTNGSTYQLATYDGIHLVEYSTELCEVEARNIVNLCASAIGG